ncbi:MAG TPA: SulP family inorganic anion transporter, partial [Bacteroidales bacterium]|nr:SulP family inorganic anion transporter [Bacteroidales bacterium]
MAIFAQFLAGVDGKRMNTINKFKLNKVFVPKFYELIKRKQYSKALFVKDLTAGVIVGVIAIPLAIAFGIASGVSPQQGLITAIIGGLV